MRGHELVYLVLISILALAGPSACLDSPGSDDDDSGGAGDDDDDASPGDDDDDDTDPPYGPALYPDGHEHSPIPPYTADTLRAASTAGRPDVFMKVGDSHTTTYGAMTCFADGGADLGAHGDLDATLQYFLAGDAAGSTPFDRESLAAEGGRTASWCISGSPSPLDQEIAAIDPAFALIQFGTNDMGMGYTYESAMYTYYEDMSALIDQCLDAGIVPALMAIPHRGDATVASWWAPTYNEVIRGLAQARQIPYIDLYLALEDVPDQGLSGDGVHMSTSGDGCDLADDDLQDGNNVRNLLFLQTLDRLRAVVIDGEPSLEPADALLAGDGSPAAPFEIPAIPFTHHADTAASPHASLDTYTGCASDSDESGPEYLYRLEITETTRLRAIVLDLEGIDIDIHLLDDTASEDGCILRDHHLVQATLEPGTYHLALDSWVDEGGDVLDGEYTLVVTMCHADDPECD